MCRAEGRFGTGIGKQTKGLVSKSNKSGHDNMGTKHLHKTDVERVKAASFLYSTREYESLLESLKFMWDAIDSGEWDTSHLSEGREQWRNARGMEFPGVTTELRNRLAHPA